MRLRKLSQTHRPKLQNHNNENNEKSKTTILPGDSQTTQKSPATTKPKERKLTEEVRIVSRKPRRQRTKARNDKPIKIPLTCGTLNINLMSKFESIETLKSHFISSL